MASRYCFAVMRGLKLSTVTARQLCIWSARFRFTVLNFFDCLRGAVANSYPNVDLLWDNVITGPWGTQKCLIANPPVVVGWPRADHGGRS
jgi:hypothetical protein